MKKLLLFSAFAVIIASCGAGGGAAGGGKTYPMTTQMDSMSYAVGLSLGQYLKNSSEDGGDDLNFDMNLIMNGVYEGKSGEDRLDQSQSQALFRQISTIANAGKQKKDAKIAEENLVKGTAFLEENGKKDGVITTESGLQYKVVKEGTGASPVATDKVKVHYHGTLIDGTVFDSSVDRGQPTEFGLNAVIAGWTEGIQLMKVGGKTTFYIPANIAYGPRSRGKIPGNATLIFDVELLDIVQPNQ